MMMIICTVWGGELCGFHCGCLSRRRLTIACLLALFLPAFDSIEGAHTMRGMDLCVVWNVQVRDLLLLLLFLVHLCASNILALCCCSSSISILRLYSSDELMMDAIFARRRVGFCGDGSAEASWNEEREGEFSSGLQGFWGLAANRIAKETKEANWRRGEINQPAHHQPK